MSRGYKLSSSMEIFPGGAVLLSDSNTVIVADLHLGCEAALEYEGLSIPRLQTESISRYLVELLSSIQPDRLVVAGDLKHNFSRNLAQEWDAVSRFVRELRGYARLEVVKGNHDNYLGSMLRGFEVPFTREVEVSGIRVLHGHSGEPVSGPTIMGHVHPSVSVMDRVGAQVKEHCFLYDRANEVLILPALSLVAGGADVVRKQSSDGISPVLTGGLSDFTPLLFSGKGVLRFPKVGKMRKLGGV